MIVFKAPKRMLKEIEGMAEREGRTKSAQIRWLLGNVLKSKGYLEDAEKETNLQERLKDEK